jgi:hypothetical protein
MIRFRDLDHTAVTDGNAYARSVEYHRDGFMSWSDTICKCFRSSFVSFRYRVLFPSLSEKGDIALLRVNKVLWPLCFP